MEHVKSEKLLHTFLFRHRQVVQVIDNTSHQAQFTGPFLDLVDLFHCEIYAAQERKQTFLQQDPNLTGRYGQSFGQLSNG